MFFPDDHQTVPRLIVNVMAALGDWRVWTGSASACGSYDHRERREVHYLWPEEAVENDCDVIAFENLTGIRERMPRAKKFHVWAFRRLFKYVEYKAEVVGISVKQVSPAYTSQRCSKCGFTHEDNRPTSDGQDVFECLKCGYSLHADYNAAKNIGLKHLRAAQKSSGGGAPVDVRLNRGTLNVNGEYVPAVSDGQNRSPRESPTLTEANGGTVSE